MAFFGDELYAMLSEFFIPRANLIKFCLGATKF